MCLVYRDAEKLEDSSEPSSDADLDVRPLTEKELRARAISNIQRRNRITSQRDLSSRRPSAQAAKVKPRRATNTTPAKDKK